MQDPNATIIPVEDQEEFFEEEGTWLNIRVNLDDLMEGETRIIEDGTVRLKLVSQSQPTDMCTLYSLAVALRKGPRKLDKED